MYELDVTCANDVIAAPSPDAHDRCAMENNHRALIESLRVHAPVMSLVLALCGACTANTDTDPTKADARREGKVDGFDWCAVYDWYGDGECDDFCDLPDPDCDDCELLCAGRDVLVDIDGWCFGTDECTSWCEANASELSAEETASFQSCVLDDPLCFRSIDDCVGSHLTSCDIRCSGRDGRGVDGWCFGTDECTSWCEANVSELSAAQETRFESCVSDDPLCFRSIDDCVGSP